jgi:hypothetical protein
MMNAYDEIFAGVKSVADLEHAIARAVRHLREAMEKEDNRAVTAAHMRNLRELDSDSLAMAYAAAEKSCTFWPTPGQIRELAGWSEESGARTALQWVMGYLAKHGVEGRATGGAVRYGEDETGRHVELSVTPVVPAPEIPVEIAAGLSSLGGGSVKQGLRYVSQHPVVKGWEGFSGDVGSRTAERIEGQWVRCYLQNKRRTR